MGAVDLSWQDSKSFDCALLCRRVDGSLQTAPASVVSSMPQTNDGFQLNIAVPQGPAAHVVWSRAPRMPSLVLCGSDTSVQAMHNRLCTYLETLVWC